MRENATPSPAEQREFFGNIEQSLLLAAKHLLEPFDHAIQACRADRVLDEREFYVSFLIHANQFAQDCCASSASAIRRATTIEGVRGTTAKTLAIQMRDECFGAMDRTSLAAFQSLAACDADLSAAITAFENTDIVSETITSAFVGGVVGGLFKSRGAGAFVGGISGLQNALHEKLIAVAGVIEARERSLLVAREKTEEYVRLTADLPLLMIDFIGAKCFGARVDLFLQESFVASTTQALKAELERAKEACHQISTVAYAQRRAREISEQNAEKKREIEHAVDSPGRNTVTFCAGAFLGLIAASFFEPSAPVILLFFAVFGFGACIARIKWLKAELRDLESEKEQDA